MKILFAFNNNYCFSQSPYDFFKTEGCHYITKTCPCNKQRLFELKKNENCQQKNFDILLIFAQNIDCGYTLEPPWRGGSNEYPQSIFWSKNKKNRYTPAYPSFAI